MFDVVQKNISLSEKIEKSSINNTIKELWLEKLNAQNLTSWEDALLYQLLYFVDKDNVNSVEYASFVVNSWRDEKINFFTPGELKNTELTVDLLADTDFQVRTLRTLYLVLNRNYDYLGLLFLDKLDAVLFGENDLSLPFDLESQYRLIYLIIALHHFDLLDEAKQNLIFGGSLLSLALHLGFDLESIVRQAVDLSVDFSRRRNMCLDWAAFMTENESSISVMGDDTTVNQIFVVKDLIKAFRSYSNNKLEGVDLINFISDPVNTISFGVDNKAVARQILELYIHLINGFFIIPDGDFTALNIKIKEMEEREKNANVNLLEPVENKKLSSADIKNKIDSEYKKDINGEYEDLSGVLQALDQLASDHDDPAIAESYYFDEADGKFKWKE